MSSLSTSLTIDRSKITIHAPICTAAKEMLTPPCLRFLAFLHTNFDGRRLQLLSIRRSRQMAYDGGALPAFPPETRAVRESRAWRCAAPPAELRDRRVEITGPVDRKMVINGLNSGANTFMADFEDSSSPTWSNMTEGQRNVRDANAGDISYTNERTGKVYVLRDNPAKLLVRPRGLHLSESHMTVNGSVMSGSLFDFGVYFFHNAQTCIKRGGGGGCIYYYIPKLEGYLEARFWSSVFKASEDYIGIPRSSIRATVLLETITAAFEMEEILYELKEHSIGLNCGRWDYLFSYIKKLKTHKGRITPDRSHLTMQIKMMDSYVKKLVYTCHKRGTFAMGGMAATIPIKNDAVANAKAMESVRADKLREVMAGCDGTWVAHPALVAIAKEVFDKHVRGPNQIMRALDKEGEAVTEEDLLELPKIDFGKAVTSGHLVTGVKIVMAYTEAWLRGVGCIPLHHKMEDAATAEISRAQLWGWAKHGVKTQDDGEAVTEARLVAIIRKEIVEVKRKTGENSPGRWLLAGRLVEKMLTGDELDEFLTTVAYPHILTTAYAGTIIPDNARSKL